MSTGAVVVVVVVVVVVRALAEWLVLGCPLRALRRPLASFSTKGRVDNGFLKNPLSADGRGLPTGARSF
jgi:hypothetical protein